MVSGGAPWGAVTVGAVRLIDCDPLGAGFSRAIFWLTVNADPPAGMAACAPEVEVSTDGAGITTRLKLCVVTCAGIPLSAN